MSLNRILSLVMPVPMPRFASPAFERMDREISDTLTNSAVKIAISRDPDLRTAGIHVATWRNVVQLSGFVESRQIIGRALAVTRGVRGVTAVRNDMRLK